MAIDIDGRRAPRKEVQLPRSKSRDPVLDCLEELSQALTKNIERNKRVLRRIETIRRDRQKGSTYTEIVSEADRPLIVELLTENLGALATVGAALRRAEAKALHDEGLSMERIGELFGVTRQRVSALLKRGDVNGTTTVQPRLSAPPVGAVGR